jgi:predicted O-linked N-acetylglucosamine transferase (SPINDLY family)
MADASSLLLARQGMALLQSGNARDAELRFRSAIAVDGANAEALMGLAIIAHQTGHFSPALELFDRALAAEPGLAAAWVNRGNTLAALGQHAAAAESFQRAIALTPSLASAYINLAGALNAQGLLDAAVGALERARELQPDSPELHNNLGNLYKDQGRVRDALAGYQQALALNPMLQQAASNRLAALKVDASQSPAQILAAHRQWSNWFEAVSTSAPLLQNTPDPERRLRIGYVSPDCHTALPAFVDRVIAAHDRERFDVFCYFNNPQPAEKLAMLGVQAGARLMRGLDDQQVANLVHQDGIDILIDIAGHTGHNRLGVFARKPAPVQFTWLDYLCTTGLAAMDYRITDPVADPPGSEENHSEKLLRMPVTQWCWQPPDDAPAVGTLPAASIGYITFGSFNNAQKLTDATLALWARLLASMPDAHLLVAGIAEGFARERVAGALKCGPSRLRFLPRIDPAAYRAAFAAVDIVLDTIPFSGATTTLDALWQGVPVLTLPGATSCSRSSASLLTACGLTQWIATSEDDFIARAGRLAGDAAELAAVRAGLRASVQGSAIVDRRIFVRDLESLLRHGWQAWCAGRQSGAGNANSALVAARAALDAGDEEAGVVQLAQLLRRRPQWEVAKRELARGALAWARRHPELQPAWRESAPAVAPTSVSVIICSIRPDYFQSIREKMLAQFPGHAVEVIGIHDAQSLCEGYNRGAAQARGDHLIFCHDDIDLPQADFGLRVLAHLQQHDVIGVVGADELVDGDWSHAGPPHLHGQILHRPEGANSDAQGFLYLAVGLHSPAAANVKALDGVFIATRRGVWEALRFDARTFDGFHLYDIDFTYRAHRAGYRVAVPHDLLLVHFSTGRYDTGWQRFNLRFLEKFPELSNLPSVRRFSNMHVKLQTLDQVARMHSALRHLRFGDCD